MTQAFQLTGSKVTPAKGMYADMPNLPQEHNVIFTSSTATDVLVAGDVVTLDTASTNTNAPVVKKAAATDAPYGVVIFDMVKSETKVGERVAIADNGDIIWLEAAGAIEVGDKVQFVAATTKVNDTTTQTNFYIGTAVTPAAADGDLLQIKLNLNLGAQA